MTHQAFDLSDSYVHLGLGASAVELADFSWTPDYLKRYQVRFAGDRDEGRLVGIVPAAATWTHWERHLGGDELVVQLSGRADIIQEIDGVRHTVSLGPGQALINPRGVWHTSDVHEAGESLFIAAGRRTVYRPRATAG